MPMLHGCSLPGCDTSTLSVYCYEHDLLIRTEIEAERAEAAARDPIARDVAALDYAIPQPELPPA